MKRKLLSMIFISLILFNSMTLLTLAASVTAGGVCGENLKWTLYSDGELKISGSGPMTNWKNLSEVPWYSYGAASIKKVSIENGVTSIAYASFYGFSSLKSIELPSSIIYIGEHSFRGSGLLSIVIPSSVVYLGGYAFYGCDALTEVTISEGIMAIDEFAFSYCTSLKSIVIPEGVSRISYAAFRGCTNLESVIIPDYVSKIFDYAFYGCSSLKEISLPASLLSISDYSFASSGLTKIVIPSNVSGIKDAAFYGCTALKSVIFSGKKVTEISEHAFNRCSSLSNIDVPDGVTSIKYGAFANTGLQSITISGSLKFVHEFAFSGCSDLSEVNYSATANDWNNISISNGNSILTGAKRNYIQNRSYTIKYDYVSNGGTSATKTKATVMYGNEVDLTPTASKTGWTFVGWNTDKNATSALSSYTAIGSVTLYAIFKKSVTTSFYYANNALQLTKKLSIYNNASSVRVTMPTPEEYSGWTAEGWRANTAAASRDYSDGEGVQISSDTKFYAAYSRTLTLSYNANGASSTPSPQKVTQYYNAAGNKQIKGFTLAAAVSKAGYTFKCWATDSVNGTEYVAGSDIGIDNDTTMYAVWEGAESVLPTVNTKSATAISENTAVLNGEILGVDIERDTRLSFVYWSKYDTKTKYSAEASSENFSVKVSNLTPSTQYYFYAKAENYLGAITGDVLSFVTTQNNVLQSVSVTPQNLTLKAGEKYKLVANVLPASAENRNVIWQTSNSKIAKVDAGGNVTAMAEGKATITATTEIGRLKSTCSVTVSEDTLMGEYDFSEWNMATNTSNYAKDGSDWNTATEGGNSHLATAYLARWDGAVLEKNDKYLTSGNVNPKAYYKELDADYHVQEVIVLPKRTGNLDNKEIKNAVVKYGGVYGGYQHVGEYESNDRKSYYLPSSVSSKTNGHAITIIGWDDNYSKYNFKVTPPGNGAFLCRNSWGTSFGDNGYYYISYYDGYLCRSSDIAVVTSLEKNTNYNTIFQYDPLGYTSVYDKEEAYGAYKKEVYGANVFPQKGSVLSQDHTLRAVSFYTIKKNTQYEVYVVTNYKNSSSLSKKGSVLASGTIEEMGYHTVTLDKSVNLEEGTRFAVIVRLKVPTNGAYIACEVPIEDYSSGARANSDESYIGYDGISWTDATQKVKNRNACIKAFTDNGYAESSSKLFAAIDNAKREYESDKVYTIDEALEMGFDINEKYIEYIKAVKNESIKLASEETGERLGAIPPITTFGENTISFAEAAVLPDKYDLRSYGCVTDVRNQRSWGTCWAHAAYGSLESVMLKKAKTLNYTTYMQAGEDYLTNINQYGIYPTAVNFGEEVLMLPIGGVYNSTVTITPTDATNYTLIWQSDNEAVAVVDTNGRITALSEGRANISVKTDDGLCFDTCMVMVEKGEAVDNITFDFAEITKAAGDVFLIDYTINPSTALNTAVSWSSSNTLIASVNENGVVTALRSGETIITATTADEGKSDSIKIIVEGSMEIETTDIISALSAADTSLQGSMTAVVNNRAEQGKTANIILAFYDEEGNMLDSRQQNSALEPGLNNITFENLNLYQMATKPYKVKIFVWNKDSIKPITSTVSKEYN